MRLSFLVFAVVALLAGSAIGHATAGPARAGAVVVSVEARGLRAATGFVVRRRPRRHGRACGR